MLADSSESLPAPAGIFLGYYSDVTGHGFPIGEAPRIAKKYFGGQRSDRSHARMRHQPSRLRTLLRFSRDLTVQVVDWSLQLGIQRQQRVSLLTGMGSQRQRPQGVLAYAGPQGVAPAQSVTERQRLQAQLYAGTDAHKLIAMAQ